MVEMRQNKADVDMCDEQAEFDVPVPSFLENDPEEAQAYKKVECLRFTLQAQLDSQGTAGTDNEKITQELTRTYVVSEMFTPEDASSLSEKAPVTPGNIV